MIENLSLQWGNSFSFTAEAALIHDIDAKSSQNRQQFLPKNFFFQYQKGSYTLKFGTQLATISVTDFLNPFDVIHAKDFKNPTNPESMGSDGFSISRDSGEFIGSVLYIPLQRVGVLPAETSPWWPREKRLPIENSFVQEAALPASLEYQITGGEELQRARSNNWMIRGQWIFPRFESALQFYEGLAQDPHVFVTANSTNFILDSPVILTPFYYKHQVTSLSFNFLLESWNIKIAGNRSQALGSDSRLPEAESSAVFAIEKNQEFKFGMLTWVFENTRQFRKSQNQISFLRSVFENAWILGSRIPIYDNHQVLIGLVYDSVGRSNLIRANYKYRVSDHWSVESEAQALQGPQETLLGLYEKYDQVSAKLSYIW